MRILVAIANHGTKNQRFLLQLLRSYREMSHDVDIVVLSDVAKDLGADVEVRVGAPNDNPWSLPFAHRRLFAERANDYDLYIYSEDDTLVEARHIDVFLELDRLLPANEVPGFLRYEVYPTGERSYCSVHSGYRWLPDSVTTHGGEVFASFTNEHSACYLLTGEQLRTAIASGGFLVEPHEGRYDMLVSAATDPYVRCGLRRRICISRIDDVLLHHLPDVYLGRLGIAESEFRAQMEALVRIGRDELSGDSLMSGAWSRATSEWAVPQYVGRSKELKALAGHVGSVLSVGCASGRLERETFGEDTSIVGIPLDEVTAAVARLRGIASTRPALPDAIAELGDARFDAIVVHELLRYAADPPGLLAEMRRLLAPGARVVISVPNTRYPRLRRLLRRPVAPALSDASVGSWSTDMTMLRTWVRASGMQIEAARGERSPRVGALLKDRVRWLDPWIAGTLWVAATPSS